MANLNKVMLIGRLTRDIELRYTPKGTAVCEVSLAINRDWKDDAGQKRSETTFCECTFWSRQAETLAQYTGKGQELFIEGRLQLDQFNDRETGQKRSKLRVIGEGFQFLGGKPDGNRTQQKPRENAPQSRNARPEDNPRNMGYDLNPDDSDDIPF